MATESFRFAGFVLDADRLELRRGSRRIEVQPKVLLLLRYLLENAERTVGKAELLEAVWPDVTVSEGSLTSAVGRVRRALDDREDRIVRTVHRLGYRMGVPVTRESSDTGRLQHSARARAAERPVLIVLPFANLSRDTEQEVFADGITEDLTTALSAVADLTVMSRNLAFLHKGRPVSPQELREQFGVQYVIEGSVQRGQDRVRINVQLIEAASGGHAWAEKYDRALADIFDLQSEIVETVLGRLRIELLDHQHTALRKKPTSSLSAYESYLRGRALIREHTPEGSRRAREFFENAVALDPDYANAYASLAGVETSLWILLHDRNPERLERAERSVRRALQLDPFSGMAQLNLAAIRWAQGRSPEALEAAHEAVRLLPIDACLYTRAKVQISLGQWQAARDSIDAALQVNPHYSVGGDVWDSQAVLHQVAGRIENAKACWERARAANPASASPRLWLAYQYVSEGESERAAQLAREILEALPEMTAERALEFLYLCPHRPEAAEQMIARFREAGLP